MSANSAILHQLTAINAQHYSKYAQEEAKEEARHRNPNSNSSSNNIREEEEEAEEAEESDGDPEYRDMFVKSRRDRSVYLAPTIRVCRVTHHSLKPGFFKEEMTNAAHWSYRRLCRRATQQRQAAGLS